MSGNALPQIEGYRILRVIGHGGMSTVYLAEQASLARKVALKVMLPEALADEVSRGRFENEARTIARLQHPHIVGIHEVGRSSDGLPFYSMPYMPHGNLAQRKLRGDQDRVAGILRALLDALDYAHVRGVVHRDVKAENVLFDEADRPQLADFGIALRRGSNPRLTSAGLAVGSTAYMPPEQARGLEVDRRADVYSLGVLAWEALTGRLPYNAGDALSMALKHVQDPIPRLPAALRHWQPFMDKALAKRPGDRYASAQEMREALDRLAQRAGRAFAPVDLPEAGEQAEVAGTRRALSRTLVVAVPLLAAVGIGMFALLGGIDPRRGDAGEPAATITVPADAGEIPLPAPVAGSVLPPAPDADALGEGVAAYVANANQQVGTGQLLAPANANAWDSWDAAWRANPTHPDVQMLTARLFDALAAASQAAMRQGDARSARTAFERARQLDARRGGDGSAIVLLRRRVDAALGERVEALAGRGDRSGVLALVDASGWLGLDAARRSALQARADAIAAGPASAAGAVARSATPSPAGVRAVTRAEYARFANATSRAAAACGREGLFGRKRDWRVVGSEASPVACVSAADAQAYADWLSGRERRGYRLPSAGELRAQASAPISGWLTLCADTACRQRRASGKPRPLLASRGYEDVGILLVRER